MSDYNSQLPIRTENPGDVKASIVDATTPTQGLAIDTSGRITAKLNDGTGNAITSQINGVQRAVDVGINVLGVQVDPRQTRALTSADVVTAAQGAPNTNANAWPVKPTDGTNSQSYLATGEAKVSITQPVPTGTNTIGNVGANLRDGLGNLITSSLAGSTRPIDTALRDSAGALYSATNPFPVAFSADPLGSEVDNYNTVAAVASLATSNHDYTVTTGKTFLLEQIEASASGKCKIEVQVETAAASGIFNTKWVQFNSTSTNNMSIRIISPVFVVAGARVRIIRTNRDVFAQDLYSTISGQEV